MSSCSNASRAPRASRVITRSMAECSSAGCSNPVTRTQSVHEFYDEPVAPAPVPTRIPILSIYLIRSTDKQNDDRIMVRTRPDCKLSVDYYDAVMNKTYNLVMNRSSLITYVTDLCTLFANDGEPFAEIQFNFNGYPTFISSHKKFLETPELVHTFNRMCTTVINSEMNTHLPTEMSADPQWSNDNIVHSPRADNHRWENHY